MKPKRIYYEPSPLEYELCKEFKERFQDVSWFPIEIHNRIKEL